MAVDLVPRGHKGPSPVGTAIFIGLRAIEPFLQRLLLITSPLTTILLPQLGIQSIPPPPSNGPLTSPQLITTLGLHLAPFQSLLFAMTVAASAKQIFWILTTSKEKMLASGAAIVGAFNFLTNALNVLFFSLAAVNPTYAAPWSMYVGVALFAVGILVEPVAEVQRRNFKDDPRNEGKPYSGGLFGLARSVNYGAYTIWRSGFALAAGGPVWAALVAAFHLWDFGSRAVPVMEEYCAKRYGAQWEEVRRKVPYKLIPWVY